MKFSAMEIYNESVRDLLSTDSTPLRLLDDPEVNSIIYIFFFLRTSRVCDFCTYSSAFF